MKFDDNNDDDDVVSAERLRFEAVRSAKGMKLLLLQSFEYSEIQLQQWLKIDCKRKQRWAFHFEFTFTAEFVYAHLQTCMEI